ncbi:MAG TPA: HD domain-containing protein [Gemmatimonadales bacterium]|nr:HD domain-containing protein [Gemmatimonadales bacterium]
MSPTETPARLPIGAHVAGFFLVAAVEPRSYGEGKECTVLTLSSPGGRIDSAPFWSARQELLAGIARGSVVEVAGEVHSYRGRRQLEVTRIAPAPGIDPAALLPSAPDPEAAWQRLDHCRAEVRGPRLAAVLSLFYDDPAFRGLYGRCPASTAGHHAVIGGLLEHTCEVAAIGRAIADTCGADADLVVAGALLHDIGKLQAYRWDSVFETTEAGALLGHVALGMLMLSRRIAREPAPPCTEAETLLLLHLVGSHHGRLEYGATAPPMTLEAEVLHYADDASARAASMAAALADPDNFPPGEQLSARGLWQLDRRRAYRGGSDWGR